MKITLAPMDGLTDIYARNLLTAVGGIDLCITEFLRITNALFPERVFYRKFPELNAANHRPSYTLAGTPVYLQLLGSEINCMAENAAKAVELGAQGIDLNYGCPARTVNRREGGAILLKNPERLFAITRAVRQAVPKHFPVTAKIRLGYEDKSLALDNSLAIEQAGASAITIHARTKMDGYRPPAYWSELAAIQQQLSIPVIANGEIWSVDDYFNCQKQSGCDNVMLGRGMMVTPDLALQIKHAVRGQNYQPLDWQAITVLLDKLYQSMLDSSLCNDRVIASRLKLWVKWLMAGFTEAETIFNSLKRIKDHRQLMSLIHSSVIIK